MAKNKNNKTISFTHHNPRILEIRRQKKAKQIWFFTILIIICLVLFSYFLGFLEAPLASFGEFTDTVSYYFMPAQTMPINVPITGASKAEKLIGTFAVVGDKELIIYTDNGNVIRRVPHGFVNPIISASDTRVCLYNRGYNNISVEGRDKTLFTHTFETPVIYTQMSNNGTLAVYTQNSLYVFDEKYNNIWTWNNTNDIPLSIAFEDNNKNFAVALLSSNGGALSTQVIFYSTRHEQAIANFNASEGIPLLMQYTSEGLLIVYDSYTALYNKNTGEEIARYNYNEKILQSVKTNEYNNIALLFGDENYPGITEFEIINAKLEYQSGANIGEVATGIDFIDNNVYIYLKNAVWQYDLNGDLLHKYNTQKTPVQIINTADLILLTEGELNYLSENTVPLA